MEPYKVLGQCSE